MSEAFVNQALLIANIIASNDRIYYILGGRELPENYLECGTVSRGIIDCSGFVKYCYEKAGCQFGAGWKSAYTGEMIKELNSLVADPTSLWERVPTSSINFNTGAGLVAGDVLVTHHTSGDMHQHTVMYWGDGQTIEARGTSYQNGGTNRWTQAESVGTHGIRAFDYVYRYGTGGDGTGTVLYWEQGSNQYSPASWEKHYLETEGSINQEQANNATIIFNNLNSQGFSKEACCVLLGAWCGESGLNPNRHQDSGPAYGLAQWEINGVSAYDWENYYRPTDYETDADANGTAQLNYFVDGLTGANNALQRWYPTSAYTYTIAQWKQLTNIPELLRAYQAEYERGGSPRYADKLYNANYFYDNFDEWHMIWGTGMGDSDSHSFLWLMKFGIPIINRNI